MIVRRPTPKDLRRMAEANHFEITDEEMEAFEAMIPGAVRVPTIACRSCPKPGRPCDTPAVMRALGPLHKKTRSTPFCGAAP